MARLAYQGALPVVWADVRAAAVVSDALPRLGLALGRSRVPGAVPGMALRLPGVPHRLRPNDLLAAMSAICVLCGEPLDDDHGAYQLGLDGEGAQTACLETADLDDDERKQPSDD